MCWRLFAFALPLLALCGCQSGEPLVLAKGRLLVNGQPYQPGQNESLVMIFWPAVEGEAKNSFTANVADDGTFVVDGRDGLGIPPGSYRVSFEVQPFPGKPALVIPAESSKSTSPVLREVRADSPEVADIDLAQLIPR